MNDGSPSVPIFVRRVLFTLLMLLVSSAYLPAAAADDPPAQDDAPGLLLLAPDRGFLGNEQVREVAAQARQHASNIGLAFATAHETESTLREALSAVSGSEVVVLPLFLSEHHLLYQKAQTALQAVEDRTIRWAEPFGTSYLAEEILFDRVESHRENAENTHLIVAAAGAGSTAEAEALRDAVAPMAERAAEKHGFAGGSVVVPASFFAPEGASGTLTSAAIDSVKSAASAHGQALVVPFHFGMKYTTMMSATQSLRWRLQRTEGVRIADEEVLPHANVARWVRRTATRVRPLDPADVGVIAVPHGSHYTWNETMRSGLAPVTDDYAIAEAFSMVDPFVIERAVRQLEAQGKKAAVMVRIFSMESSFRDKAEYILGLRSSFEGGMMGGAFPSRIRTHLQMTTLGGLEAHPLFAKALLDRAQAESTDPSRETVILLAHGTGPDAANERWMNNLHTLADTMRAHGGDRFRDIKVHTWREDWPEKRKQTLPAIRKMVTEANAGEGTAIVIPARTAAQGPAPDLIGDLDFRYGHGFAPHPLFADWLRQQIETGIDRLTSSDDALRNTSASSASASK